MEWSHEKKGGEYDDEVFESELVWEQRVNRARLREEFWDTRT